MKSPDTLLRRAEHAAISKISLTGKVIDLGGDKKSHYQKLFQGDFLLTVLNNDPNCKPDITHDLNKPLPIGDSSYDGALLINVLEHIYDYRPLLRETARILKTGGTIVIVVPFMFPYHPSPGDFHRYTKDTLILEMESLRFSSIKVEALGAGVFSACFLFIDRLMPSFIRFLSQIFIPIVVLLDKSFARTSGVLGKKYKVSDYALGYAVVGRK